jgi:hypothetical protein
MHGRFFQDLNISWIVLVLPGFGRRLCRGGHPYWLFRCPGAMLTAELAQRSGSFTGVLGDEPGGMPDGLWYRVPVVSPKGRGVATRATGDPTNGYTSWQKIPAVESVGPIRAKTYLPAEILRVPNKPPRLGQ